MSIFEDLMLVQKRTLKKSIKSFKSAWPIVFSGIVYMVISSIAFTIISFLFTGILSIIAGLALAIVSSSLISNYLYLLFNAINYNRVTLENFKEGFTQYIWKIYGIFFIAWVVNYLLSIFTGISGSLGELISIIMTLFITIFLNPLPETVYQKYYSSAESIKYAFEFVKENWLNWFIPNIILFAVIYVLTGKLVTNMFTTHIALGLNLDIVNIIRYIIGQTMFSFAMIYRGHLFALLSTSTRRKRMFMSRLYED